MFLNVNCVIEVPSTVKSAPALELSTIIFRLLLVPPFRAFKISFEFVEFEIIETVEFTELKTVPEETLEP